MKDKTCLVLIFSWLISLLAFFAVAGTRYWGFKPGTIIRYSALIISIEISMVLLTRLWPYMYALFIKFTGSLYILVFVSLNVLPGPYHYGEILSFVILFGFGCLASFTLALIVIKRLKKRYINWLVLGQGAVLILAFVVSAILTLTSAVPDQKTVPKPEQPPDVNTAVFKDQGYLAFTWNYHLYVLDGQNGKTRQLVSTKTAAYPVWSSDGEWLAFINPDESGNDDSGSLWLTKRDGSQAHIVKLIPGTSYNYRWSPTENLLAVTTREGGLWLVTPGNDIQKQLVTESGIGSFAWSLDGKSIAYNVNLPAATFADSSDALYTVEIGSGKLEQRLVVPKTGIWVTGWSPDRKEILYWVEPIHSASLAADGVQMESYSLDPEKPNKKLVFGPGYNLEWYTFSQQGRMLAVEGGGRMACTNKALAVIDLNSGRVSHIPNPEGYLSIRRFLLMVKK